MSKKIAIVDLPGHRTSLLAVQRIKEEFEAAVEIITIEEAKERTLTADDIVNLPVYKIERQIPLEAPIILSGKSFENQKVGKGGRARKRSFFKNKKR